MGGDSQKIFIIRECCLHYLQINGQFIEWRQLWDLFEKVVKMRVVFLCYQNLKGSTLNYHLFLVCVSISLLRYVHKQKANND